MAIDMNANALSLQPNVLVPGANIDAYLSAVGSIPVLTAEEEKVLVDRFYEAQDLDAARQLVLAHLRFVAHIAKSYSGYGLPQADLIQEGNIGLMKAIKRFDPGFGVRLVSFAVHWIKAEIHEYVLKNWRIVKIATTKAQRKLFFNLRSKKKQLGWLSDDEIAVVAEDLGVAVKDVREMEGRLAAYDAAFDGPSDDDDDHVRAHTPAYYLEDSSADPALKLEELSTEQSNVSVLADALAGLDERSRDILKQRWLTETKSTLHELADKYGISAERVRQLEQNAMKKLKSSMADALPA